MARGGLSEGGASLANCAGRAMERTQEAKLGLTHFTGPSIPKKMLAKVLTLVEHNMKGFYGASWDGVQKREELSHAETCLLLRCHDAEIHAVLAYRIEWEEGVRVAYIYEIQVAEAARGEGWGSMLLQEVEQIGRRAGTSGLMLTVHRENERAIRFYTKRQGFEISPLSPSLCAPPALLQTCDYEVMQLLWDTEARETLRKQGMEARRQLWIDALDEGSLHIRLVMRSRPVGRSRGRS